MGPGGHRLRGARSRFCLPNDPWLTWPTTRRAAPGCLRSSVPSVMSPWTASPPPRWARSSAACSPRATSSRLPRSAHDGRPGPGRGPALLCGQGQFLDDLDPLPGTLVATIVRSPYPHVRITGFDARAALASPGVAAVIGPAQTAELIDVDYEELPAVTGTQAALATGAPRLHPDAESNVATDRTFSFGPVQAAFAAAGHVVSGDYSFPRYSSMPMECYCVVANWAETAEGPAVEAWVNFHGPFSMVPVLAGALGVPASRLRLHVPADIGGSFGIKAGIYPYVALMALASKHAGRPVRWTEDRLEHLVGSSAGADRLMRFEAAVTADGTVTALRADLVDNVGAYLRPPEPSTLYRCFGNIAGAYRIPAVRIRARAVVHQQDADRPEPGVRRAAAVLRPGTADGQGRGHDRPGPGRGAAAELHRRGGVPLPHADRRGVRLGGLPAGVRPGAHRG